MVGGQGRGCGRRVPPFVGVPFGARNNNRPELYEGGIGRPTEGDSKKGLKNL